MENQTMKDFEKELNNSFRVIKEGDMVSGIIVDINDEEVTLDINYYAPGVVPLSELSFDPDFSAMKNLRMGDSISAVVTQIDDGRGNVELSRKDAVEILAWEHLEELLEQQSVISVKVKERVNGGVIAYLNDMRAFIPASQLSLSYVEDTEEYIGKTLEVRVITADKNMGKLVLSAKSVLKEKAEEADRKKQSMIIPGTIFEGTVERLMPYGAFVQMENGLSGLVHISKISMKRIKKPSEILSVGERVKVKVLEVKDGKISLSIRDVETNTSDIVTEVVETEEIEYKSEEIPNNPFAALLADIKVD